MALRQWFARFGLLAIAALPGCTAATMPATPTTHLPVSGASPGVVLGSSYSSPPLSFEFPSEWTAMSFEGLFTPFASPLVFVSNQLMEDPCNRESVCRPWPASVLEPGGVVLKWSSNGFPGWRFADQRGRAMTVGGHAAKLVHRDVCGRSFGADRSLAIIVRRAASNNWYELDACFRDPTAGRNVRTVMSLVQTVRFGPNA